MSEKHPYLTLLDDLLDVRMLMASLRHEKKPTEEGVAKPSPQRVNEIDAHLRVLDAMEKHLSSRKTFFIAEVMIAAAGVTMPEFDAAATHHVGERIRELAQEMNVDLREELAPWVGEEAT